MPWCLQNFLYENSLQYLPVYTMGISAGAAFAVKIPKAFYEGEWAVGWVGGILLDWQPLSLLGRCFGQDT